MVDVIDIGTIIKEDSIFYLPENIVFTLNENLRTEFVLKLMYYQNKLINTENMQYDDYVELLRETTYQILREDKSLNITRDYIEDNFSVDLMYTLINKVSVLIYNINSDDNLKPPKSSLLNRAETTSTQKQEVEFMRNITTLTKYYGLSYKDILNMPYAVFLSYLKFARVYELEKTDEGRELLESQEYIDKEEPDLESLRNLKI